MARLSDLMKNKSVLGTTGSSEPVSQGRTLSQMMGVEARQTDAIGQLNQYREARRDQMLRDFVTSATEERRRQEAAREKLPDDNSLAYQMQRDRTASYMNNQPIKPTLNDNSLAFQMMKDRAEGEKKRQSLPLSQQMGIVMSSPDLKSNVSAAAKAIAGTPAQDAYNDYLQQLTDYSAYRKAADFAQYSQQGAAIKNPSFEDAQGAVNILGWRPGADEVGNIVTFSRENIDKIKEKLGSDDKSEFIGNALYGEMSEGEVSIYNYLLAKEGAESAQRYLDSIEQDLNQRYGQQVAGTVEKTKGTILNPVMVAGMATSAGLDQWAGGVKQALNEYEQSTSAIQYAGQEVREQQGAIGKFAYDAINTLSNMAPSILASYVAAGLGAPAAVAEWVAAGSLGLGSGGNAYKQALAEGRSKDEAKTVAALTGASETVLSKLLSGIGAFGGLTPEKLLPKVAAIENAIWRVAAAAGVKIGGEVIEEELQLFLEPLFKTVVYGDEYDTPSVEETVYTALLTAVTTGLLEGGDIAKYRTPEGAHAAAGVEYPGNQTQQEQKAPQSVSVSDSAAGDIQTQEQTENPNTVAGAVQNDTEEERQKRFLESAVETIRENQKQAEAAKPKDDLTPSQQYAIDSLLGGNKKAVSEVKNVSAVKRKTIETTAESEYTENERTEIEKDGDAVRLREGGEWLDGADPAGSVPAVESRAGQDQSGAAQRGSADGEISRVSYGEKVSSAQLGIEGGSDLDGVYLVDSNKTSATRAAQTVADERGLELVLFAGGDLHTATAPNGARGYTDGKKIFARADDPDFTAEQITRHEAGHDMLSRGEIDLDQVRGRVVEAVGSKNVETAAKLYAMAYAGSGLSPDEVWAECICDSLGGMNLFAGTGSDVETFMDEIVDATRQETEASRQDPRGPPVQSEGWASRAKRGRTIEMETMENNRFERLRQFGEELPEVWYAYTRGNFYTYRNLSFMDYEILGKVPINEANKRLIAEVIEEVQNNAIRTAEDYRGRLKNLRLKTRRYSRNNVDPANRNTTVGNGGVSGDRSGQSSKDFGSVSNRSKNRESGVTSQRLSTEELVQEIERIREEGRQQGRGEEDVLEDIRAAVDEVYQGMIEEFGEIEPGEKPYREIKVPKRTAKDKQVSQTVRTILEAQASPDEVLPKIEELVARGDFSYDVYSDKAAIADAENAILDKGYSSALAEWMVDVDKGIVSKENTAQGWALYNAAVNSGDTKTAIDIINRMVEHQRNAAQAVQATRILKKLSPDAQLYAAQRSIRNLQEEINKRYKSDVKLKIDEELAEDLLKATTEEDRTEILRKIYRNVGKQVPSRFIDKWNAWRYLAMLGNVRTHVRNVVGNAGFAPVVLVKNVVATGLETVAGRVTGGKAQRTKALVGFGKQDTELLQAAFGDYGNAAEHVGTGKYSDFANMKSEIEEGRQIFKSKALETARKANSAALSKEDEWFAKTHYAYALAQYCKANGISAKQITEGKIPDAARLYAIKEAKKATYQDVNQLSEFFSRIGRYRGDNTVMQGMSKVVEGILPFRKTPANILARGVEYSPLGIIKTVADIKKVQNGDMPSAELMDSLASNLTGTGLMALGAFAALSGLVRGSGEGDDDEREFHELQGHQSYALELPGGASITLDWLAPECLPFFVGVNICEVLQQRQEDGKTVTMSDLLEAIGTVTDPMLEMSCLQSLSDVFDSVGYASSNDMNPLVSALASAVTSYLTQGIPTLLGQFERSGENVRMTSYTEKNAFLTPDMQYLFGKASARVPGLDYNQIPYIDAWGRMEDSGDLPERIFNNMVNPAYTSEIDTSPMEEELLRLYEVTGEAGVFPSRADKYFTVDKQRKDLTAEEYVKYATARGQTAMEIIAGMTENSEYKKLDDTDKAAVVKLIYELANAKAKMEVSDYQPDGWIGKAIKCCEENNIPPELYIIGYHAQKNVEGLKDADGNTISNSRGLLVMQAINAIGGLTYAQRWAMCAQFGVGGAVIMYTPKEIDAELKKMRK